MPNLDEVFDSLYRRMKALASRIRWTGTNPTLNPTALVHEAYLKLRKDPPTLHAKSTEEIISLFAGAMRQILIDAARRKNAQKRRVPSELPGASDLPIDEAMMLDSVLDELQRENPMQFRIVECRFLLGMTVSETASALGVSNRTVEREWQEAKERLRKKIQPEPESGE
jgi:RNA polymerase sigma factor (TIGR02999 family)